MRYRSRLLPMLALLALGSCPVRTATSNSTVFDVQFTMVSAGNIPLTEWQDIPQGYEDYRASYIKSYSYRFYHNGSMEFVALYGFFGDTGDELYCEKEVGTYQAAKMGPYQRINIALSTRETVLTWEPNPRDPAGNLVFRVWENRIMDFGCVDDDHPAQENVNVYIVLLSQSISPHPL